MKVRRVKSLKQGHPKWSIIKTRLKIPLKIRWTLKNNHNMLSSPAYLTGYFVDGLSAPMFLFIIPFPLSPLGFAAYGGLTIAIVIGIPLGLVIYVSEYAESIET
jgi:hypothetical protein